VGEDKDKMLHEAFLAYFEDANNIVEKWRYIFLLNFHVYNEWWQKRKDQFKGSLNILFYIFKIFTF
jgi:hypothetical protein